MITARALGALAILAGLAAAQSPVLLVLNKAENTLAIVDPASGKVLGRVPTGESPHEVVAQGKLAFVSNYGGKTLSVIDVAAARELRRVDLGPLSRPHGLASHGGAVYFTAEANKLIGRYDPAGNRVDWLLGTGQNMTHMVIVAPDGDRIFTANIGSDSVTIMNRAGQGWDESQVAVGKGPEGMDLSPDGRELWAAQSRDGGVSIIDVAARSVRQTLALRTQRSNRLKFTPDGKRVLISDMGGGELLVVDAAGRREIKRLKIGTSPEGILMAPGGARAYVSVAGDNHVAVLDLHTLEVTGQLSTGSGPDGLAWGER